MTKQTDDNAIVVLSNLPDKASAEKLAEILLQKKLAACINILAPCESRYIWQGNIEHATEYPVMIKTTQKYYAAVESTILTNHPYELPEVIQVLIEDGHAPYLAWIKANLH
jgi:periplasmic divalent cation tolerance protein